MSSEKVHSLKDYRNSFRVSLLCDFYWHTHYQRNPQNVSNPNRVIIIAIIIVIITYGLWFALRHNTARKQTIFEEVNWAVSVVLCFRSFCLLRHHIRK